LKDVISANILVAIKKDFKMQIFFDILNEPGKYFYDESPVQMARKSSCQLYDIFEKVKL
jgi:hypothetical protein